MRCAGWRARRSWRRCSARSANAWPRTATRRVYLSLDIDCLDPAFAPGTGTPEPGGMSTNQVLSVLEELADLNFVGMDCVEVAPPYDHAELTSKAAANFVWRLPSVMAMPVKNSRQEESMVGNSASLTSEGAVQIL